MADEELDEIDVPKKSKLPLILGVVSALLLGGAAGFGASMMLGKDAEASVDGEGAPEIDPETGEPIPEGPSEVRAVVDLGSMTINLRGGGGGRVVRMDVKLEASESFQATITEREAELRNTIIMVVSDYAYADLEGLDGKVRLQDEILARINGLMAPERIDRVYFNAFHVQ